MDFYLFGPDSDAAEFNVYENLPPDGEEIDYAWPGGTASTNRICLSVPLLAKWYGATSGDPMIIEMNPNRTWDFDGRTGTPGIDANAIDFEGTIVHELGHHFGFVSETENLVDFFYDFVSNWDIFRFPASVGPTISALEMSSATRGTERGVPAIAATSINDPARVYSLATGVTGLPDGQASHWLDFNPVDPQYIGIMDVAGSAPGTSDVVNGAFLQSADIQAFDLMGYEIDEDGIPGPVGPPAPRFPVAGSTVSGSGGITFQ